AKAQPRWMINRPSAMSQTRPVVPTAINARGRVRPHAAQTPSSNGAASGRSQARPANSADGETPSSRPYHGRISSPAQPVASQMTRERGKQVAYFGAFFTSSVHFPSSRLRVAEDPYLAKSYSISLIFDRSGA